LSDTKVHAPDIKHEPSSEPLHISAKHFSSNESPQSTVPRSTEGPSWRHPVLVLGAVSSFLEPFCGELLSNVDKPVDNRLFKYPHEGPCEGITPVDVRHDSRGGLQWD